MKNPFKVKEVILKTLDMAYVMEDYHVQFAFNPHAIDEVQFKCPFHGKDNKPSARFYKSTQSAYCWVCMKRWDIIDFIMERENVSFIRALQFLINKYKIDVSGIPDEPEFKTNGHAVSDTGYRLISVKNKIRELRGSLPLEKYKFLCAAYYMITFSLFQEKEISAGLEKIENKLNSIRSQLPRPQGTWLVTKSPLV